MRAGNYLYNYYKKELIVFKTVIEKNNSKFKEEQIHELRVSIKKIRWLFQFLEFVAHNDFKVQNNYDLLKPVFKRAGKLRAIQVNRLNIKRYRLSDALVSEYRKSAKSRERKAKAKLKKTIKELNRKGLKSIEKAVKNSLNKMSEQGIADIGHKFIIVETKEIRKLMTGRATNTHVHETRKHLKALHFSYVFLQAVSSDKQLKKHVEAIKKTEILIGEWHDKLALFETLKKLKVTNKKDAQIMGAIVNECKADLKQIQRNLKLVLAT